MMDENNSDEVGYGKPPKRTQFVKGRSGNPKGRPKGSRKLTDILAKVGRQRIMVTENGRSRSITKLEASVLQLMNKAVSGDLKAFRQVLLLEKDVQTSPDPLEELIAEMRKESKRIGPPENQ
jgi:hypothetical protein